MQISLTFQLKDPQAPAIWAAAGLDAGAPPMAPPAATPYGLAVLDAAGAAIVAAWRNASSAYLRGLKALAAHAGLTEADLLKAVGSANLIGFRTATTRRAQKATGRRDVVLFRTNEGVVVVADQTRKSLADYLRVLPTEPA
jgi:hypothetical protein